MKSQIQHQKVYRTAESQRVILYQDSNFKQ